MKQRIRKLNRLKGWDYSENGFYFVTICVKDRKNEFGEIKGGEMILNQYGEIIRKQWEWLKDQYSYVYLDVYTIMPNHFHGVLGIDVPVGNGRDRSLPKIKSLSELIGAFKMTSSKQIHLLGYKNFHWQKSFHDHIIRNEKTLEKIREYIVNNPLKWEIDIENPQLVRENSKEH